MPYMRTMCGREPSNQAIRRRQNTAYLGTLGVLCSVRQLLHNVVLLEGQDTQALDDSSQAVCRALALGVLFSFKEL